MRKFLQQLPPATLSKIAHDYSAQNDPDGGINRLVEIFKAYGLRVEDLKSRYGL